MNYSLTCVCGDKVSIEASSDQEATETMVMAMDQHVAEKDHPQVPKDLTHEQKVEMVKAQMKQE